MRFFLSTIFLSAYTCINSLNTFSMEKKTYQLGYKNLINFYAQQVKTIDPHSAPYKKNFAYKNIQPVCFLANKSPSRSKQKVFNLQYPDLIKLLKLAAVTGGFRYDEKKDAIIFNQHQEPEYSYDLPFNLSIRDMAYTHLKDQDFWEILKEQSARDFLGFGCRIPATLSVQARFGATPGIDQRGNLVLMSEINEACNYSTKNAEITYMKNVIFIDGGSIFQDWVEEIRKAEKSLRPLK